MRPQLMAAALSLCVVAAACGSTVPADQRAAGAEFGEQSGRTTSSTDIATGSLATSENTAGSGAASRRQSTSTSGRKTASTKAAGEVVVGYQYPTNPGPVVGSLGLQGVSAGDQAGYARAVVDYVNRNGGINGRKITLVFHEYNIANGITDSAAEGQKTCTAFAEDNHVFAVLSPIATGEIVYQCLANHKTALIDDSYGFFSMADPKLHTYHFSPAYPETPRAYAAFLDNLVSHNFFPKGAKIGVARDTLVSRAIAFSAIDKGLKKHGLKMEADFSYTTPDQVAGGILRFKALGISHVFVIDGSGGLETLLFMDLAQSQGFNPAYALNSLSGPDLLQANAPKPQLNGAGGIGWLPTVDVGIVENSQRDRDCLKIIRDAGLEIPDHTASRFALAACDVVLFFTETMRKASAFDLEGLRRAGEGLGQSFVPFGTFTSRFGPGRHDGPNAARYVQFSSECGCFSYVGGLLDLG